MFFFLCLSCQNQTETHMDELTASLTNDELTAFETNDELTVSLTNDEFPRYSAKDIERYGIPRAVRVKLKPQSNMSYLATEDPEIIALVLKHDLSMSQTCPGPKSTPELLLYYNIQGKTEMSKDNWENAINEFLATGKFEYCVYEYGISDTC